MALTEAKHSSLLKSAGSSLQSFYGGLIHPAHTHARREKLTVNLSAYCPQCCLAVFCEPHVTLLT